MRSDDVCQMKFRAKKEEKEVKLTVFLSAFHVEYSMLWYSRLRRSFPPPPGGNGSPRLPISVSSVGISANLFVLSVCPIKRYTQRRRRRQSVAHTYVARLAYILLVTIWILYYLDYL
jgi:hypothetical protein